MHTSKIVFLTSMAIAGAGAHAGALRSNARTNDGNSPMDYSGSTDAGDDAMNYGSTGTGDDAMNYGSTDAGDDAMNYGSTDAGDDAMNYGSTGAGDDAADAARAAETR